MLISSRLVLVKALETTLCLNTVRSEDGDQNEQSVFRSKRGTASAHGASRRSKRAIVSESDEQEDDSRVPDHGSARRYDCVFLSPEFCVRGCADSMLRTAWNCCGGSMTRFNFKFCLSGAARKKCAANT